MTTPERLYGKRVFFVAALGRNLFFALALAGVPALPVSKTLSAALLLVGFAGGTAMHLVIGILGYRRAMRAPWPKVPPVADDDWD